MIDVQASVLRWRANIEFGDEVLDLAHLEGARKHNQRVGALVGNHAEIGRGTLRRRRYDADPWPEESSAAVRSPFPRAHDLFDLTRHIVRIGHFERDHGDVMLAALDIEAADNAQQPL